MTLGSCLCGAVGYEIAGPFSMLLHCHCSMCRKHHGASFGTFAAAPLAGFRWLRGEDQVQSSSYASSTGRGSRSFCKTCGSVAPNLSPEMGLVIAPAGNLLGELGGKPQGHLFAASKAPWYTITDSAPQYDEYPPEWNARGVERPAIAPREGVVQGSCLCAGVAFELRGAASRMMNCHCTRCRRGRSAAHATNVFYSLDALRWTRDESGIADYALPGARFFGVAFCKRCGAKLPRPSRERGVTVVPAGSLDGDPGIRPMAHIFTSSKASWFDISDGLPQFAERPPRA